jgi:hypothetical protein
MRFGCSSEFYRYRSTEPIGLARSRLGVTVFQPCLRGFPPDTGPRSLAFPGSSSPDLTATSEYYPLYTCTSALASVRLPWGSFLLRDISTVRPPPPGIPLPDFVPPSAFLTLSTVYSARCLAGLFHPAAVSEVHSSGVFPDRQPPWLVARPFPLGVRSAHLH